jgi:hypothetical protein
MAFDIPQVLGHHGNELRYYDELLGGKNEWRNLFSSLELWKLLAIRYVIASDSIHVPGFHRVLGPVQAATGRMAYLYEADAPAPYARVVPGAVKVDSQRLVPTLLDPRMDPDRVVLFDEQEPITPAPLSALPPPSPARAAVTFWEPGRMTVTLEPAPAAPSYLVVAENWYLDWQATVDGTAAPVLRGDEALITVAVPAGARRVELVYRSSRYRAGGIVSILAAALVLGCFVGPALAQRIRRG